MQRGSAVGVCIQWALPEGSASRGSIPLEDHPGTWKTGGMYPTGMLSCLKIFWRIYI